MAQTTGANSNKAFFTNTDKPGEVFHVQFNPKEFKLDDKATWKASEEHETHKPLLTYEKGEPTTISMDLIFDTTDDQSDVYQKFVIPLRDFLTADVTKTDSENHTTTRPPFCKFTWGSFNFSGVIEKVSCTFMMFSSAGTPLRAKVNVGMKEQGRVETSSHDNQITLTAFGAVFTGAGTNATTVNVLEGDTVNSIAHRTNAKPRDIALANNLPDMVELKPGSKLVVPANGDLARILARQSLRHTPAYWTTTHQVDPFRVDAKAGDVRNVPSALDEAGPVALDYAVEPGSLANAYVSFAGDNPNRDSAFILAGKGAEYGPFGPSDFTFGERTRMEYGGFRESELAAQKGAPVDYGEFGPSEQTIVKGDAVEYGTYSGSMADDIRNDATPDEQGEGPTAQTFGDYGPSDAATTKGDAVEYGTYSGSAADAIRRDATPDEQGAGPTAQTYGGYGESEQATTKGDAVEYGTYSGSAADAVRNDATPDEQGQGPTAQTYGNYGQSDQATTPGSGGGPAGGYGPSDQAAGGSGGGAGSGGAGGDGAGSGGGGGHGDGAGGGPVAGGGVHAGGAGSTGGGGVGGGGSGPGGSTSSTSGVGSNGSASEVGSGPGSIGGGGAGSAGGGHGSGTGSGPSAQGGATMTATQAGRDLQDAAQSTVGASDSGSTSGGNHLGTSSGAPTHSRMTAEVSHSAQNIARELKTSGPGVQQPQGSSASTPVGPGGMSLTDAIDQAKSAADETDGKDD